MRENGEKGYLNSRCMCMCNIRHSRSFVLPILNKCINKKTNLHSLACNACSIALFMLQQQKKKKKKKKKDETFLCEASQF